MTDRDLMIRYKMALEAITHGPTNELNGRDMKRIARAALQEKPQEQ